MNLSFILIIMIVYLQVTAGENAFSAETYVEKQKQGDRVNVLKKVQRSWQRHKTT